LRRPELRQLTQRVSVAYHLGSLSQSEANEYIRHRLTVAGGDPEIFSLHAVQLIEEASQGTPRIINTICDMALVYGFAEQKQKIDVDIIKDVLEDRRSMGLP
jgi:general secretion pathway protein A